MRGVYRGTVPPRAAAPLRHRERNRTGGAHRRAVFRRQYADLVLDRRHAARLRLHVPDDSVRCRHRQARRAVHHGTRVRAGGTGGVAALADRHVHRHAQRPIRGLRLACRLTARCHLRIVFRPGLASGTRQFQPDRAHVADGFRGDRDGGHHDRHLRHEQPELHFDEYAVLRFGGPGNLLHPHVGGFLRIRDSVCAAGTGPAHGSERGNRVD